MTTEAERAEQRDAWRQARAALAKAQRTARYRRKPPRLKAGMLRRVSRARLTTPEGEPDEQGSGSRIGS